MLDQGLIILGKTQNRSWSWLVPVSFGDPEAVLAAASQADTALCSTGHQLGFHTTGSKWDVGSPAGNLSTVAAMPVSEDVPLTTFALELQHALSAIGKPVQREGPTSHRGVLCLKGTFTGTQLQVGQAWWCRSM